MGSSSLQNTGTLYENASVWVRMCRLPSCQWTTIHRWMAFLLFLFCAITSAQSFKSCVCVRSMISVKHSDTHTVKLTPVRTFWRKDWADVQRITTTAMYMQKFTSQLIVGVVHCNTPTQHLLAKYVFKHFMQFSPRATAHSRTLSFIHSIHSAFRSLFYALVINDHWSFENTHENSLQATFTVQSIECLCIQVPFIAFAHRPPNICHFHYYFSILRSPNLCCQHLCTHPSIVKCQCEEKPLYMHVKHHFIVLF